MFTQSLHVSDDDCDDATPVSVDGVRALSPILVTLNACVILVLGYSVTHFPEPEQLTFVTFFGIVFCVVVCAALLLVTVALVWSLSEPRQQARARHAAAVRAQLADETRMQQSQTCFAKAVRMARSWQFQTFCSMLNHLGSVLIFSYGLYKFEYEFARES